MTERYGDAALRHLVTADMLERAGRLDDAAYHYGLVGEMALKEAITRAMSSTLPASLRRHINQGGQSLQQSIAQSALILTAFRSGRIGGALGYDLMHGLLNCRFTNWAIDIRYADTAHCPVNQTNVTIWREDAVELYNNGVF